MGKKKKTSTPKKKNDASQLFNFARDSYFERTSRPIYAIIFLLPFIVFYEIGTFRINTDVLNQSRIRVVAFVWMQNSLELLGFHGKFAWIAPPLAVLVILIALQITSGKQWRFWLGDILPMAVECVLLAVPLIVLTLFLSSSAAGSQAHREHPDNHWAVTSMDAPPGGSLPAAQGPYALTADNQTNATKRHLLANIITGIGAGIYEELVFRLVLICILMLLFQDALKLSHTNAIVLSVLISAAMFSAHHHIDFFSGRVNSVDPFNITKFVFRTIAGVYFAALFAVRGFGITAGTHAFYNIIAVSITAHFFR
ncbi:MAG: CPBP family intramembrane metalloprotease [Sedimentisphaerales bacterium]|nr:CPBP family intramembrane metalloprotease [Sedimentisphaerales bacterium]